MVNRGKIKKSAKTVVTDNRFDVSIFAKILVFTGQHDEPNYNLFNFPDAAKSKKDFTTDLSRQRLSKN